VTLSKPVADSRGISPLWVGLAAVVILGALVALLGKWLARRHDNDLRARHARRSR
jgi:hypothetical protein